MYWILGIVSFIGLVIRIWQIAQPIAYDEAYTFINFATRDFKTILADYSAPNNHIFHTILVRIAYDLFGKQIWIVRLPALLAGTFCIPAAYFASRRIHSAPQSLAGAALVALTPWFINYSVNGRGYTLVILLSLLLGNLGALLIHRQNRTTLAAYAITAALGFYTIPIFLYPMAGISLWVLATHLTNPEARSERMTRTRDFLVTCVLAGLLTLVLYLPVIVFGTGIDSIVSNDIVESRDWMEFIENLQPRSSKTWESWMIGIAPAVQYLLLGGFLVSLFFYRKASRQRLPLQVFLILGIAITLLLQRVAPLARVWMYLEAFYMIFAGAGLAWSAELLLNRIGKPANTSRVLSVTILVVMLVLLTITYLDTQQGSLIPNRDDFPEQYAADYLASHLQTGDKIVSISPVDIQTAYYLYMHGIPYDTFYHRDNPQEIQNAVIVLRRNSKYNTPAKVLRFFGIEDRFDLASRAVIYKYGPIRIISVPAK